MAPAEEVGAAHFGPGKCVTLSRQAKSGTCLMQTKCEGVDISSFEFMFDCIDSQGAVTRHSFGRGSFDAVETFDTDVRCAHCRVPKTVMETEASAADPVPAAAENVDEDEPARLGAPGRARRKFRGSDAANPVSLWLGSAASQPVSFGPGNCVTTRKLPNGHCEMETKCTGVNTTGYDYGLVCKTGNQLTRHLFGTDSFDPVEKFDTLIACDECLGLDASAAASSVAAGGSEKVTLQTLAAEVSKLKAGMQVIAANVQNLTAKVLGSPGSPGSPAPAPAAAKMLMMHHHKVLKTHRTLAAQARQASHRRAIASGRSVVRRSNLRTKAHHQKAYHVKAKSARGKAARAMIARRRAEMERAARKKAEKEAARKKAEQEKEAAEEDEQEDDDQKDDDQEGDEKDAADEKADEEKAAEEKAEEQKAKEEKAEEEKAEEEKAEEEKEKAEEEKAEEEKAEEEKAEEEKAEEEKAEEQKAEEQKHEEEKAQSGATEADDSQEGSEDNSAETTPAQEPAQTTAQTTPKKDQVALPATSQALRASETLERGEEEEDGVNARMMVGDFTPGRAADPEAVLRMQRGEDGQ